jgi:hypothetical protein
MPEKHTYLQHWSQFVKEEKDEKGVYNLWFEENYSSSLFVKITCLGVVVCNFGPSFEWDKATHSVHFVPNDSAINLGDRDRFLTEALFWFPPYQIWKNGKSFQHQTRTAVSKYVILLNFEASSVFIHPSSSVTPTFILCPKSSIKSFLNTSESPNIIRMNSDESKWMKDILCPFSEPKTRHRVPYEERVFPSDIIESMIRTNAFRTRSGSSSVKSKK